MSYTFSRRAFLKYSAATAVAVAGASLLGGCEYQDPNNPVSKELPSAITSELQVTSPDALSHQVKKNETVTYFVSAKRLNALTDGPVTFTFYPDLEYSEFSANWELTADALKSAT